MNSFAVQAGCCGWVGGQTRRQETCQEANTVIQVKVLKAGIKVEAAHTEQESLTLGDY